jgi:hypothetical protein
MSSKNPHDAAGLDRSKSSSKTRRRALCLLRPLNKCLAGTLYAPPAEQIRQGVSRIPLPLACHDNQRGENSLSFLEAQVDFPAETAVPAEAACG